MRKGHKTTKKNQWYGSCELSFIRTVPLVFLFP
jgi:hypothetical protein